MVPHDRLLRKIRWSGVQGELANWMQNWLNGTQQRVVVEGCFLDWMPLTAGVPRGSMLDLLVFVMYINDLGWQMECNSDKCEVLHFGQSNQGRTFSKWEGPKGCYNEEGILEYNYIGP